MSKAITKTKKSKPKQKEYGYHNYCPCCGAQVKGKGAWPHDDECPYRK